MIARQIVFHMQTTHCTILAPLQIGEIKQSNTAVNKCTRADFCSCVLSFIQSKLGYLCLLLCTAHAFLYGWDKFLHASAYKWWMPSCYMLALVLPCIVLVLKAVLIMPCMDRTIIRIRQGWERPGKAAMAKDAKSNQPLIL